MASTTFQVRQEQLAGGEGRQGLPRYAGEIQTRFSAVEVDLKDEGKHCLCQSLAFAVLAAIVAAGAAYLFATSGGPTNLLYFVPACVLSTCFAILTGGIVVAAIQSTSAKAVIHRQVEEQEARLVDYDEFILAMLAAEQPQLEAALGEFETGELQQLMERVAATFDGSEGQQRMIAAAAQYTGAFAQINFEGKRPFALCVLAKLHPQAAHAQLLPRLKAAIGLPADENEAVLFAGRFALIDNRDTALAVLTHLPEAQLTGPLFYHLVDKIGSEQIADVAIRTKYRDLAIVETGKLTPAINQNIQKSLFDVIGDPLTPGEAALLATHASAVVSKQRATLILQLLEADQASDGQFTNLFGRVEPVDEATCHAMMRHPTHFTTYLDGVTNRDKILNLLKYLPKGWDGEPTIERFVKTVGAPKNQDEYACLARYPKSLVNQINANDGPFALAIEAHQPTDPTVVAALETKLPGPDAVDHYKKEPAQLAKRAFNNPKFTADSVRAIFAAMDIPAKAIFLKGFTDLYKQLPDNDLAKQKKHADMDKWLRSLLTAAFAQAYSAKPTEEGRALLQQVARWPRQVGLSIFEWNYDNYAYEEFVGAHIVPEMAIDDQSKTVSRMGEWFDTKGRRAISEEFVKRLNYYSAENRSVVIPFFTKLLMGVKAAQFAEALCSAQLGQKEQEERLRSIMDKVYETMGAAEKKNFPKIFHTQLLTGTNEASQAAVIDRFAATLTYKPDSMPDLLVIHYYTYKPLEKIKKLLEGDEPKAALAVYLLAHLNGAAADVIAQIDAGVHRRGYSYYNLLLNAARERVDLKDQTPNMKVLVALLKYAPQAAVKTTTFGELPLDTTTPEWKDFNEIAQAAAPKPAGTK